MALKICRSVATVRELSGNFTCLESGHPRGHIHSYWRNTFKISFFYLAERLLKEFLAKDVTNTRNDFKDLKENYATAQKNCIGRR